MNKNKTTNMFEDGADCNQPTQNHKRVRSVLRTLYEKKHKLFRALIREADEVWSKPQANP